MKAAVLYDVHTPLKIEELDPAEVTHGMVGVRLCASGVCHSDWHVVKGDWPFIKLPVILGHEGAGIVEEVGNGVTGVAEGDHVILAWRRSCGYCEMCQEGFSNLCNVDPDNSRRPRFKGRDETVNKLAGLGTFGTYTVVPQDVVVPIPKDYPLAQAALIGCGVMTGVGAVINTAKVPPGKSVAIFGCGGVGLNCIQGAVLANAEPIIAVDILDTKLEMAEQFGATHTINSSEEDPVERIKEITGGAGAHYAFEAIGLTGKPFLQTIQCTRRRGMTVFIGHAPVNTPVEIDARILMLEKSVIGSYYGTARTHIDFNRLLSLYGAGKLKLDELVTRTYPLEGINDAFDALEKGEVARSVLDLSQS